MNKKQGTNVARVESENRPVSTKNIPAHMAKLPGAIARLMAGPPMSERDRYDRDLADARGRSDWLRPP